VRRGGQAGRIVTSRDSWLRAFDRAPCQWPPLCADNDVTPSSG
jgi:hypothetical protein